MIQNLKVVGVAVALAIMLAMSPVGWAIAGVIYELAGGGNPSGGGFL